MEEDRSVDEKVIDDVEGLFAHEDKMNLAETMEEQIARGIEGFELSILDIRVPRAHLEEPIEQLGGRS